MAMMQRRFNPLPCPESHPLVFFLFLLSNLVVSDSHPSQTILSPVHNEGCHVHTTPGLPINNRNTAPTNTLAPDSLNSSQLFLFIYSQWFPEWSFPYIYMHVP